MELGEPMGWGDRYKDNLALRDNFFEELNIPTYNWFQHFLFWDVLISLANFSS